MKVTWPAAATRGKRQRFGGNVCRVRQELARCTRRPTTERAYLRCSGSRCRLRCCNHPQATRLPLQWRGTAASRWLNSLSALAYSWCSFCFSQQLLNSAATITTLGHKQMDADSQARQLLDRMAIDFAQMVKRI